MYFVTGLNYVLQQPSTAELAQSMADITMQKRTVNPTHRVASYEIPTVQIL